MSTLKPRPRYSSALEANVLGAYLLDYGEFGHTLDLLEVEDFHVDSHRRIFELMQRRHRARMPIDFVVLEAEVVERDREALGAIACRIPIASAHEGHVRELKHYAQHRAVASAAWEIVKAASDPKAPLHELAEKAPALIATAMEHAPQSERIESLSDVCVRLGLELVEGTVHPVVSTGIDTLDSLLTGGGFGEGHLVVLGARPASGKSALAAVIAHHAADLGTRTLFATLEMTSDELTNRVLQSRATAVIANAEYRTGMLGKVHASTAGANLYFTSVAGLTPSRLRAMCLRAAMHEPYGLVVVDYLQLMDIDGKGQRSRYEVVTELSRALKALAMELRVPVLALSQLSRNAGEFDAPELSDLRESGQIEQDANTVLLLHRLADDSTRVHLRIAKQRGGKTGLVRLEFLRELMRFERGNGDPDPTKGHGGDAPTSARNRRT